MIPFRSYLETQNALKKGSVSCTDITTNYLQRISENKNINAFIEVYTNEALALAKLVDKSENSQEFPLWFLYGELALQQEIMSLRSTEEKIPNTKYLLKEKELSNTKNLAIEKLKLERSRTADLPLLKFKVVTISKHSYSPVTPNQTLMIVVFGVAFGLFISIFMAFLIDLKQLRAKEIPSAST